MFICDECHAIGCHERGCSQWRYYPDLWPVPRPTPTDPKETR